MTALIRQFIAASAATASLALSPTGFASDEPNTEHLDLTIQASEHARQNQALSLIISHGPQERVDPQEVAQVISGALSDVNIDVRTYFVPMDTDPDHMSFTFLNGYTSQGPMDFEGVKTRLQNVVDEYRRFHALVPVALSSNDAAYGDEVRVPNRDTRQNSPDSVRYAAGMASNKPTTDHLDITIQASDYARENGALSMIVSHGPEGQVSRQELASNIA